MTGLLLWVLWWDGRAPDWQQGQADAFEDSSIVSWAVAKYMARRGIELDPED